MNEQFRTCYVDNADLQYFEGFILPDILGQIKEGIPLLTIGLISEGTACGALCASAVDQGILEILSIYVAPDYRRAGGGRKLMDTLISLLPSECDMIRFSCAGDDRETKSLRRFAEGMGARKSSSHYGLYRTTVGRLAGAPYLKKGMNLCYAEPFAELSEEDRKSIERFAAENCLERPPEGFFSEGIETDYSVALIENGEIQGYLVVDDSMNGDYTISALYDGGDIDVLRNLLCSFLEAAEGGLARGTVLYIPAADEELGRILSELLSDEANIEHSYEFLIEGGSYE